MAGICSGLEGRSSSSCSRAAATGALGLVVVLGCLVAAVDGLGTLDSVVEPLVSGLHVVDEVVSSIGSYSKTFFYI